MTTDLLSKYRHVMVDIETMATNEYAAIVSIGAVVFDPGRLLVLNTFYANVSLEDCVYKGLSLDPATVMWWMKQSKEAQESLLADRQTLDCAVNQFSCFLVDKKPHDQKIVLWGNGADFDNKILRAAYRILSLPVPWHYDGCFRSVCDLFPHEERLNPAIPHNALSDALTQASHLLNIVGSQRAAVIKNPASGVQALAGAQAEPTTD